MARPPTKPLGPGRTRAAIPSTQGNQSYNCYCRWELCPVGSNRGGSCIVLIRIDGRRCDRDCSYRDLVLARLNASVSQWNKNPPPDPPRSDPPGLVPPNGDNP